MPLVGQADELADAHDEPLIVLVERCRLVPVEIECLNMFPDNHTLGVSDSRRAFLMGNALVTGIVERLGLVLQQRIGIESCTNLLA